MNAAAAGAARPGVLALATRNLSRWPGRAAAGAAAVLLAAGALFAAVLLVRGAQREVTVSVARLGADLLVVPEGYAGAAGAFLRGAAAGGDLPPAMLPAAEIAAHLRATPGVAELTAQVAWAPPAGATEPAAALVAGYDPAADFSVGPWLEAPAALGPGQALVGPALGVAPGDTVQVNGRPFTVAGRLQPAGDLWDRAVFIPLADAAAITGAAAGQVSAVLVKVHPWEVPEFVAGGLEQAFPQVTVVHAEQVTRSVGRAFLHLSGWFLTGAAGTFAAAFLLVGVLFGAVVNERSRELGMLRALGATTGFVLRLILTEAALVALAGALAGLAAGAALLLLFAPATALRAPAHEWAGAAAGTLALAVLTAGLATLGPALRGARRDVLDAIRSGE